MASSFLFLGPEGVGKRTFAIKLAQALLCQTRPEEALDPCGACPACTQVLALTHPDLDVIAKPKDKSFLPLELLIGDKQHRMRRGLCHRIALKPFMGGRKIAVIDDADYLNAEGANCLLKTLEEPPPRSALILIGTSAAKQLPTIRSRCQRIRFAALPVDVVAELLLAQQVVSEKAEAVRLARYAEGSLARARELADPELWSYRRLLYQQLAEPAMESVRLAKASLSFVNEAGKEASARRRRMRQRIGFAAEFYRHLLRGREAAGEDPDLSQWVRRALDRGTDLQAAAACLDRCLEAAEQIDRNVNQATCLESWLDALARRQALGFVGP